MKNTALHPIRIWPYWQVSKNELYIDNQTRDGELLRLERFVEKDANSPSGERQPVLQISFSSQSGKYLLSATDEFKKNVYAQLNFDTAEAAITQFELWQEYLAYAIGHKDFRNAQLQEVHTSEDITRILGINFQSYFSKYGIPKPKHVSLRIPSGYKVWSNNFYEWEPVVSDGKILNYAEFDQDMLDISSVNPDADGNTVSISIDWHAHEKNGTTGKYFVSKLYSNAVTNEPVWDTHQKVEVRTWQEARDVVEEMF